MIQASEPHLAQADWNKVDASTDPAAYMTYLNRLEVSALVQHSRQEFLGGLPCLLCGHFARTICIGRKAQG